MEREVGRASIGGAAPIPMTRNYAALRNREDGWFMGGVMWLMLAVGNARISPEINNAHTMLSNNIDMGVSINQRRAGVFDYYMILVGYYWVIIMPGNRV